jgi:hypothetical protein
VFVILSKKGKNEWSIGRMFVVRHIVIAHASKKSSPRSAPVRDLSPASPHLDPLRNQRHSIHFINHQPSTINHQPSTINHQPSTINHQISIVFLLPCWFSARIFLLTDSTPIVLPPI